MHCFTRYAFLAFLLLLSHSLFADEKMSNNSGGQLIIEGAGSRVLLSPIDGLSPEQQKKRRRGHAFFNTLFIADSSELPKRSGLGPLFNGASCEVCHNRLGRGQMPNLNDDQPVALVIQLSTLTKNHQWQSSHPVYGDNFNPFATKNVPDEGRVNITYKVIKGHYSDGSSWELFKPEYEFTKLTYGSFDDDSILLTRFSPRLGQSLIGMGLLEAIAAEDIIANADPDDSNNDGISGRANQWWQGRDYVLGRFGWKANQSTLRSQIVAALKNEMGIKTTDHPQPNCSTHQITCFAADKQSKKIELSDEDLDAIVFFTQTIPVPKQRNSKTDTVQKGKTLFNSLACQKCHTANFTTKQQKHFSLLSQQQISPYTDLLLHDMGPQLADDRPDKKATGREWRTAPLWGIGLNETITGEESYLHDGRAKTLEQAILWHGGEAEKARQGFIELNKQDRERLISFLKSL